MPTERQSALVSLSIHATVFLQPNQISHDVACWNAEWPTLQRPCRHNDGYIGERYDISGVVPDRTERALLCREM